MENGALGLNTRNEKETVGTVCGPRGGCSARDKKRKWEMLVRKFSRGVTRAAMCRRSHGSRLHKCKVKGRRPCHSKSPPCFFSRP